ncbi:MULTISPECIES: hypothetical protein [unclassified Clostridioides]|uniref:hypothetical protein n=1 Tax=unclassified Clostridioides TaxID=2635829 RepID=UPI001D11C02C|nr:hypothetical protein [Clostridioides sp. ZZV14-6045]MCC0740794.1 hypothetical protein [Clostridioides sp. ZZV14-5902]
MFKNLSKTIKVSMVSVLTLASMSTYSFADQQSVMPVGEPRIIQTGEGESMLSEERAAGTPSDAHYSTISMGNQLITGQKRSYPAGIPAIQITVKERTNANSGMGNLCKVTLQKYNGLSTSNVGSQTTNLKNVGSTYMLRYSRQAKGSYRYQFDNRATTIGSWDKIDWFRGTVMMYAAK